MFSETSALLLIVMAVVSFSVSFILNWFKQCETNHCRIMELEAALDSLSFRLEETEAFNSQNMNTALDKINSALDTIQRMDNQDYIMDQINSLRQHTDNVQRFLELCIDGETKSRKQANLYIYKHFYELLRAEYRNGNPQVNEKFRELNQAFGY